MRARVVNDAGLYSGRFRTDKQGNLGIRDVFTVDALDRRTPGVTVTELQGQTGALESRIVGLLGKLKQLGRVESNRGV